MKIKILLITLIISHFQIYSQTLLTPINSESFGLSHHTNRDVSYFSHVDTNKNTIIIGSTEKDSTFTDIITTKLNESFDLVWQKRLSIGTDLSYDIPIKSLINSDNQLYLVGRSAFNQSNSNGLIFIVKYDENGNIVFNQTIGNIDGSDYVDYGYLDASLNDDGTLNLVYSPFDYQTYQSNNFTFLKISNQGDILNSFTIEIPQNGLSGIIKNGKYYFLVKELVDEINYTYSYKFYQIQNENNVSITEITDATFNNYYNNAVISDQLKITIDVNENCYLTCQKTSEKINFSKIDSSNTFNYSINTPDGEIYHLIDAFINEQNENIVIANNLNNNRIDFIRIDENNILQATANSSNILATGFKKNQDATFFITTSNSNIRLFSNELLELKSFNTSNLYDLIDFEKIDDQSISTIGTSYAKMFPESDYYTQLNIQSEKLNDTQSLNNYSFSGIGTSRAFQRIRPTNHIFFRSI
jgi:predicted transcriptional regulator